MQPTVTFDNSVTCDFVAHPESFVLLKVVKGGQIRIVAEKKSLWTYVKRFFLREQYDFPSIISSVRQVLERSREHGVLVTCLNRKIARFEVARIHSLFSKIFGTPSITAVTIPSPLKQVDIAAVPLQEKYIDEFINSDLKSLEELFKKEGKGAGLQGKQVIKRINLYGCDHFNKMVQDSELLQNLRQKGPTKNPSDTNTNPYGMGPRSDWLSPLLEMAPKYKETDGIVDLYLDNDIHIQIEKWRLQIGQERSINTPEGMITLEFNRTPNDRSSRIVQKIHLVPTPLELIDWQSKQKK